MKKVSYKKFNNLSKAVKEFEAYEKTIDYSNTKCDENDEKFVELERLYLKVLKERAKLWDKGIRTNLVKRWEPNDPLDEYRYDV